MHENGDTTVDVEAARDALEKFVMENDELLELEARIGRFNIFDALGIVNAEIKHSNFLGWLLDPAESHGAGDLFLKAILMDMLRQTPEDLRPKGVSPIDLDGATIADVEIRREWRNIDLLIRCESPRLVIAIENKIRSGEHGGQLLKYKKIVREAFPDDPSMFVFLTREGDEPSDDDWTTYSYGRIKEVLERVRRTNEGAIGEDVDTFLDHYLHLIGSRLMDDQIIDDLCRKIYKNHRQAIELIIGRIGNASPGQDAVRDILAGIPDWTVVHSTDRAIIFVPTCSLDQLVSRRIAARPVAAHWIFWQVRWYPRFCILEGVVGPADNVPLRRRVVNFLQDNGDSYGLSNRKTRKKLTDDWTRVFSTRLAKWLPDEGPDEEKLVRNAERYLRELPANMPRLYSDLRKQIPELTK
jgi:hypothetical protein